MLLNGPSNPSILKEKKPEEEKKEEGIVSDPKESIKEEEGQLNSARSSLTAKIASSESPSPVKAVYETA